MRLIVKCLPRFNRAHFCQGINCKVFATARAALMLFILERLSSHNIYATQDTACSMAVPKAIGKLSNNDIAPGCLLPLVPLLRRLPVEC